MSIVKNILEKANFIYEQIGVDHTEYVYQKALVIELYNLVRDQ